VQNFSDVRQIEIHTADPLVSQPSTLESEIAVVMLERYYSTGCVRIPAEIIQTGDEQLRPKILNLIHFICIKEELLDCSISRSIYCGSNLQEDQYN
jgi:hypothetical protein